jgi:hypothetical protein
VLPVVFMALLKQVAPAQGATRVIDGDTTVVILDESIMIPAFRRSLLVIDTAEWGTATLSRQARAQSGQPAAGNSNVGQGQRPKLWRAWWTN